MKLHYKTNAELKSNNTVPSVQKYYLVGCFLPYGLYNLCWFLVGVATRSTATEAYIVHTVKLIYHTRIVGRRQVTVRFMN